MIHNRLKHAAVTAVAALALAAFATACEDTTADTGSSSSSEAKKDTETKAPSKSVADQFAAYVAKSGTANEKAAAKHVVKIQGGDDNNDIADTADIHTDLKGDLMDQGVTGSAKLLSSAFADFQESRGKDSKNGLVTVYNASGDIIGNGQY